MDFRFVRGPKPSLGGGAFCYAVTDFWNDRFPTPSTLSFEALAHEPGSPWPGIPTGRERRRGYARGSGGRNQGRLQVVGDGRPQAAHPQRRR